MERNFADRCHSRYSLRFYQPSRVTSIVQERLISCANHLYAFLRVWRPGLIENQVSINQCPQAPHVFHPFAPPDTHAESSWGAWFSNACFQFVPSQELSWLRVRICTNIQSLFFLSLHTFLLFSTMITCWRPKWASESSHPGPLLPFLFQNGPTWLETHFYILRLSPFYAYYLATSIYPSDHLPISGMA